MIAPRQLSRPDRVLLGRSRSRAAHELADFTDAREYFRAQQRDSQLLDPGRLIQSAFLDAMPEDDAETVLIAWLAVLPKEADAAQAAAQLARHLHQQLLLPLSVPQRRLLDLLAYVATHRRPRGTALPSHLKRKAKP